MSKFLSTAHLRKTCLLLTDAIEILQLYHKFIPRSKISFKNIPMNIIRGYTWGFINHKKNKSIHLFQELMRCYRFFITAMNFSTFSKTDDTFKASFHLPAEWKRMFFILSCIAAWYTWIKSACLRLIWRGKCTVWLKAIFTYLNYEYFLTWLVYFYWMEDFVTL